MFTRYTSLVPIGIIEAPTGNKLVFSSDESKEPVSFEFLPDQFCYFRCRAISADEVNQNGDKFEEAEVKKAYKSFIGVGLYKDHNSDSVDKSIGKVLWAEWIPNGKYVECYCAVDKNLAPDLAYRVKAGIATSVSMGASVAEATCSICGNRATNIHNLCSHMTPGSGCKGQRNAKGEIIFEINRGIQFNELSLVTVPADPTARIFEIYASLKKKANPNALKNLKLMYLMSFQDLMYRQPLYEQEVDIYSKDRGKVDTIYGNPVQEANEQLMRATLGNPGNLTPEELSDFQHWIVDSHLPMNGAGLLSDVSEKDFVKDQKSVSQKFLWQLPLVDLAPEHAKAIESLRYKKMKDDSGHGLDAAKRYFEDVDALSTALYNNEPVDKLLGLEKSREEKYKALFKHHKGIFKQMLRNDADYSLLRGYTDQVQSAADFPPLEPIVKEWQEDPSARLKIAKEKEVFNNCKRAYEDLTGEPFEPFWNETVSPEYKLPPEGATDEFYRTIGHIKDERFDAAKILEPFKHIDEESTSVYEATKDESREVYPDFLNAKKKKEEAKTRAEEKASEKARKRNEDFEKLINPGAVPAKPEVAPAPTPAMQAPKPGDVAQQAIDYSARVPELQKNIEDKTKKPKPIVPVEEEKKNDLTPTSSLENNKVVIKIDNSMEEKMAISIGYNKGASLATSFFEAKQGNLVYRVAASEVLPLSVQAAINQNDVRVATPEQLVADLSIKFSTLDGFKAWAKKRKKKNRKAALRMASKEDLVKNTQEPKVEPAVSVTASDSGRNNEMPKETLTPVTETQKEETKIDEVITPVVTENKVASVQAAFALLSKFVESKLGTKATEVVKMEAKIDGVAKTQPAPEPKGAIKEVESTENPKGNVATAALKAEAMDENWTVKKDELEKLKGDVAAPEISMDSKEISKEEVPVNNGSKAAASKVKKYFAKLGPGANGTPELAMDLKSSENSEVKLLRAALAKEQAEKANLLEKERLAAVADKIYNIVATLRTKNLVTAAKEGALIDTLTQKCADTQVLEGVTAVVDSLSASTGTPAEEAGSSTVVPQTFDTIEQGGNESPEEILSKHWND